jgi:hypothetical protein
MKPSSADQPDAERAKNESFLDKLASQNIRLLVERQRSGKPLTRAELQQVENYFGQQQQTTTWAKSLQELASMFNVTRAAVKLWIKKGAPAANASGFYPIEAWREWVENHGSSSDSENELDKSRLVARQVWLKNQKLEIELQTLRGEVLHRDEVRRKLFETFDVVRRLQLRIGPAIAHRISGLEPAKVSEEITRAIRETYVEIENWATECARAEERESGRDAASGRPDSVRAKRKKA